VKNWLKHPDDINQPLTGAEITGMTFAGTSLAMLQIVISVFIAYFYTNVVGISAAMVGTLLLITRIADAFSDLGMGIIISKTRSQWGQARPWGLRMACPLLLLVLSIFYIPAHWGMAAKTVYACISYFLLVTVALTPASIIGSIIGTNMTVNPNSRKKNAMISSLFMIVGSVVGNVAVLQITQAMGDSYGAWRFVAILFGTLAFAGQVAQFLLTRERVGNSVLSPNASSKATVKSQLPALIHNKYFLIMCLVGMMTALDGAMAGCILYYVKYVLHNMELVSIIGAVTLLSMTAGIALTRVMEKKIPAKRLILAGLAVKIITLAINFFHPANLPLFLGFAALRGLMSGPMMVYSSVYLLNTIEYGEYKTGIRANHLIVSISSVWTKIGAGLGGALMGWLLNSGGYDGAARVQSIAAQNMIVSVYFLIPLVASVVTFILLSMYDLDRQPARFRHV